MLSIKPSAANESETSMAYEFVCIGNAIVDLISPVNEDFIERNGLSKGSMMLVDADESARRLALLGGVSMAPGGSAANTAACLASLGRPGSASGLSPVAFLGKVGADPLGTFFKDGMRALGVDVIPVGDHPDLATANCLAMITPDRERTMSTHLGACVGLGPDDVDPRVIAGAEMVFVEGYLLDSPTSALAVRKVVEIAEASGTDVALTLSDAACVRRNLEGFRAIAGSHACRLVFANEREAIGFHGGVTIEDALAVATADPMTVVTLGKRGAVAVVEPGAVIRAPAAPVKEIVDLVGAGDAFAAGFLHGYAYRHSARAALAVGAECAGIVISGPGARPSTPLREVLYREETAA
jgi:sugar/nucleoside kinase (ribokinase family)